MKKVDLKEKRLATHRSTDFFSEIKYLNEELQIGKRAFFRDLNLKSSVRKQLEKYGEIISISDLEQMTILDAQSKGIKDIGELEHCGNIERMNLANNEINDISVLLLMPKLRKADLSGNRIDNLEILSTLTHLEYINLSDNPLDMELVADDITKMKQNGTIVVL